MAPASSNAPSSTQPNPDQWITVGRIVSPQGLNGELKVYPETDFPERFLEPGDRWLLKPNATEPVPVQLLAGRHIPGKGLYVIRLKGVNYRDQAEALRKALLLVSVSDRPPLEEGEFHILDLVNLAVIDQPTGEAIGKVIDVLTAGNDLLEVSVGDPDRTDRTGLPNVLIPFVHEIVPVVDLDAGRIEIVPPPGLLDLEVSTKPKPPKNKPRRPAKPPAEPPASP